MNEQLAGRLLDLAIKIQQIPAPTFEEGPRAAFMRECFQANGLADVSTDAVGNVFGRMPGEGTAPPVVISAHIDTVFPAGTDLTVRRNTKRIYGPGLGDNAIGVAGLLGLVWAMKSEGGALPGDIHLVANVGEEGLGNLRGMQAVVARFGERPLAYLVLEGIALGHIFHRGMGVQRHQIEITTAGGHSWVDHGHPSAIHELAKLVVQLVEIPLPKDPRTTLNVGTISGGTSVNTIASTACIELDLRSEDAHTLTQMGLYIQDKVRQARKPGLEISIKLVGQRPPGEIPATHPLVSLAEGSLRAQGITPHLNIGSTDANLPLSQGLAAICVGLTTGGRAHSLEEYIDIDPLPKGLGHIHEIVSSAHELLPTPRAGT